ncbi:MAG: hypothetical protein ACI4TX_01775 [Christensenellales bacterium]
MESKKDLVKECLNYSILGLKQVEYFSINPYRPFCDVPIKKICAYFENNECFINLSNEMKQNLISEIHYRLCDKFEVPYFNIQFQQVSNFDEKLVDCASTDYRQLIKFYIFDEKQVKRLSKSKRDTIGLNYLDTIIHETRHCMQYYYLIQMLKGKEVPVYLAFISLEILLSNIVDNTNIKNFSELPYDDYFLNGAEIDARIFTNQTLKYFADKDYFEDKERLYNYNNNDNYILSAVEHLGKPMANAYIDRLEKIINVVNLYVDLNSFEELILPIQKYSINDYKKSCLSRENKARTELYNHLSKQQEINKNKKYNIAFNDEFYKNLNSGKFYNSYFLLSHAKALNDYNYADLYSYFNLYLGMINSLDKKDLFVKVLNEKIGDYYNELKNKNYFNNEKAKTI